MIPVIRILPILIAFIALACGGGGDNGGKEIQEAFDTATDIASDTSDAFDTVGDTAINEEVAECELTKNLTGYYYLIDYLGVEEPAGPEGALKKALTDLWNNDIKEDRLIILFKIDKHDKTTGELVFSAGTGVKKEDKYQMISNPAPSTLKVELDGCRFKSTEKGELFVYPNTVTVPIPIIQLFAEGYFSADAEKIEEGLLEGAICRSAAEKINFEFPFGSSTQCLNFAKFMDDIGVTLNLHDVNCADQTKEGYSFKGKFGAHKITNFIEGTTEFTNTSQCNK